MKQENLNTKTKSGVHVMNESNNFYFGGRNGIGRSRSLFGSICVVLILLLTHLGCTDLNVGVESELTPDIFPATDADFIAMTGPVYTHLYRANFRDFWMMQELTADGAAMTARAGGWYDGARYHDLGVHNWNADHSFVGSLWNEWFNGINRVNQILSLLEDVEESDLKRETIAEMRGMRAFFYYFLMDFYGDVPIVSEFGQDVNQRDSRSEVFDFIESELLDVIPDLNPAVDNSTYGRMNRWTAYTILARIYLNSEIYTGTGRWNDVVQTTDMVIQEAMDNGSYTLDNDFWSMFAPDNGPQIQEFIFAIPYDRFNLPWNNYARFWVTRYEDEKYGLDYRPAGQTRAWPEYYDLFEEGTKRYELWHAGPQYDFAGNPIIVETTNEGLDVRYDGPNPNASVEYQLEFTRDVEFRSIEDWDTGDDVIGHTTGYRYYKFEPDPGNRDHNNDWPLFRYADILLMKAEAILRGASPTMGDTPLSLVNMVRDRAGATPAESVDLDYLLDERAREFAFEGWRRSDLIRFGKFEEPWGNGIGPDGTPFVAKGNSSPHLRIFPVPTSEMNTNPQWSQNPGY